MKKLAVVLLVISIVSCTKISKTVQIDNPTINKISVKIDKDLLIDIAPKEVKEIFLESGKHKISINDSVYIVYIDSRNDYLLNPSFSNYILTQTTYQSTNNADKPFHDAYQKLKESNPELNKIPYDTIEVKGYTIAGNFLKTNELLIEKIWDYSVNQTQPNVIKSKKIGDEIVKIYREDDFNLE